VYRINPVTGEQRKLGVFQVPTDLAVSPGRLPLHQRIRRYHPALNLTNGTVSVVNPLTTLWNVNGLAWGRPGPVCDLRQQQQRGENQCRTGAEAEISRATCSRAIGLDFLDATNLVVSSLLGNRVVKVALAAEPSPPSPRGPMVLTNPGYCGGWNRHLRGRQGQQVSAADFGNDRDDRADHAKPDVWHRH